jgi:peptide/nickel transport system substrate-binding protein
MRTSKAIGSLPRRERERKRNAAGFRLIPALFSLVCVGCNPAKETANNGHDRPIEMLVSSDAETLDPRYATDFVGLRTSRLVHAGLARLDPATLEPKPYLAKAWHWVGEDGRTLWVDLREDISFHSGASFGAKDVVATIRAVQSPAVASRHARVIDAIGDVIPEGEHAVRIVLKRAHATLLTDLEIPILRSDEAAGPPRPDGNLDGLGPFRITKREAGAIHLAPTKTTATTHAVTIRTVHDENARALRMHAGRADLVVNGFSPTLLPALESAPGLAITTRAGANTTYMLMRVDRGPLVDLRLRQAIGLAIDRDRITKTLLSGRATPASTILPPAHWAYTKAEPLLFQPAEAKELVVGAIAKEGPIHLTLLTSTDRLRGTIARQIKQDFEAIGIDLEVVPLELGTMIARLAAGDFELATLQMPELTEPNILRVFLHSSSVPPAGANRGRVRDQDVDRLLDEGAAERDPQVRLPIYASLEKLIRDRALLLPLWHEDHVAVVSTRARAFRPSAEGRWLDLAALP